MVVTRQIPVWDLDGKTSRGRKIVCEKLIDGPFGVNETRWGTGDNSRTVLVVVHSVTAGTRLTDVTPLLESDLRIQVVFTSSPSSFPAGTGEFLRRLGAVVVPWQQAIRERFDLAVAASYGRLEQLHAPALTLSHGVGYGKYPDRWKGYGPAASRTAWGLERQQLVYHGRVIPAAIALAHGDGVSQLKRSCPEAVPAAFVAGDPCYDRLTASLPFRDGYRRALGVKDGQKLVVVSSTWGPGSLLGRYRSLVPRLLAELPRDEYRVVAILHPNIWHWHGHWQVQAWYADAMRNGLGLVPPEEGWRAALAAADVVVGDHGSVTCYAASIGVPVLLAAFPKDGVDPDSPVTALGRIAPRMHPDRPLLPQLTDTAAAYSAEHYAELAGKVTSVPGFRPPRPLEPNDEEDKGRRSARTSRADAGSRHCARDDPGIDGHRVSRICVRSRPRIRLPRRRSLDPRFARGRDRERADDRDAARLSQPTQR